MPAYNLEKHDYDYDSSSDFGWIRTDMKCHISFSFTCRETQEAFIILATKSANRVHYVCNLCIFSFSALRNQTALRQYVASQTG